MGEKIFSKNLKRLRLLSDMSQAELALKLGTSRSNISNYEIGKNEPTLSVLINIAKVFNISLDMLTTIDLTKFGSSEMNIINESVKNKLNRNFERELIDMKNYYEDEKIKYSKYINEDIPRRIEQIDKILKSIENE